MTKTTRTDARAPVHTPDPARAQQPVRQGRTPFSAWLGAIGPRPRPNIAHDPGRTELAARPRTMRERLDERSLAEELAARSRLRDDEREARRGPSDDAAMEAFVPPPPVLVAHAHAERSAPVGSALAHAEAAALADRLVTSMQVGRIGRDRHEVRMKLASARGGELAVAIEARAGTISAILTAAPGERAEAERVAGALRDALAARGIELGEIVVG